MISVIVPVYNAEKYLRECVDSVLSQTFIDFELLLIDDGSTDSSGAICDEYAEHDSRVRVFHKENGGVSSARNLGLSNFNGSHLIFMDSDDYWYENTALEQLYKTSKSYNLDIIRGEYKAVDEDGKDLFIRPIKEDKYVISNKVIDNFTFLDKAVQGEYFFVLCLVKKEAISTIKYNVARSFLEDMELMSQLMLEPKRCMYVPIRFYAYRKLATSASNRLNVKNLKDSFDMCDVFHNLSIRTEISELKEMFRYNSVMMYYWTLDTLTLPAYYSKAKELIAHLNLKLLQKKVCQWSNKSDKTYPCLIKFPPFIGVMVLKLKHSMGNLIRQIRR